MAQPVKERIQVHQDWVGDIPLKNLWTVSIYNRQGGAVADIGARIQRIIDDYQPGGYIVEQDLIDKFTSTETGLLLAQSIAMPREGVSISTTNIQKVGGFINGYIGEVREKYGGNNIIDITFIETNTDIFDFFIKPWVVATSYKGLIEDELDIKCNITLVQYTRTDQYYNDKLVLSQQLTPGASSYKARKIITLFDCAPIRLKADQISYGQITESDITNTVGWTFSHYSISNPARVT